MRVSGDRVCVWEEEVVESAAASASCSPAGVPLSCRYVDAGGVSRFGSLRYGCPPDWALSGSSCSRSESVERSAPPAVAYSCGRGVLVGSSCVEYAEAVRSCLPGWVLRASGSCERVVREAARSGSVSPTLTSTSTSTTTTTTSTTVVSSASRPVSASSSPVVVVGPPGFPRGVRVSLGVGSASLRWEPPVSDGGSPISGYRLEFREGINGAKSVEKLPASARGRAFSSLKGGVSYYVKLWAVNKAGKKSAKVIRGVRPCSAGEKVVVLARYDRCEPVDPPRPPAPGELVLTPGVGSLTVGWGAPASSTGDAAVAGFSVGWRRERGGEWSWAAPVLGVVAFPVLGVGSSSYVISGLTGGVSYQVKVVSYSVRSVNSFPVFGDGVPLVDHSCPSGSEPGFWRQVFDPAVGVCVGAPGGFTMEVDEGGAGGELAVSAKWSGSDSSLRGGRGFSVLNPVSEYVVRWRRSGSSGDWVSVTRRWDATRFHRGSVYSSSFWEDVYVIGGLTNGVSYEVEVEARNVAGSSSAAASGVPCPAGMKYDTGRSRCVGRPPEPLRVEVTPGDQSLSVEWWQQDPLPDTTPVDSYRVVLHSLSRFSVNEILNGRYAYGLARTRRSWGGGFPTPSPLPPNLPPFLEGVGSFREFIVPLRYHYSSFAPRKGRLRNGHHYVVVVYSENAAGESRKFAASGVPCGDDDEDCAAWPPRGRRPEPLVCAEGTLVVRGMERCVVAPACAQGLVRPPGGGDCVTPGAPSVVSSEFTTPVLDVSAGPRAGTIDVQWRDRDFNNGGLELARFLLRWRRLGGPITAWSTASVPPTLPSETRRTFRISDLAVGSRYLVELAARNAEGVSSYTRGTAEPGCGVSYIFTLQRTYVPRRLTHIEGKGLCIYPPKAPAGLTTLPAASALNVSWRQEAWDNQYPVTGYKLRWREGSTGAWTEATIPWTSGVVSAMPGPPRKDFTHTIGNLPPGGTFYEVQVAADNQIPGRQSPWVAADASTCPTGRVRFTVSSGCSDFPALPSSSSRVPVLFLYPGSRDGSLIAVWWQNVNDYTPSSYRVQWKLDGVPGWSSTDLLASATNVPLPAVRSSAGWRLNSHELTGLDMCTHDVRIFALRGAERGIERVGGNVSSAAPRGAVTAPGGLERAGVYGTGGGLSVFWQRPECDGGSPLSYQLSWGTMSGATFTRIGSATVADDGNRFYRHNITGLTDGRTYRVVMTPENTPPGGTPNPGPIRIWQLVPDAADMRDDCVSVTDGCWEPYDLPVSQHAVLNDSVRRGEVLRVCTSSPDFVNEVDDAVDAWNNVLPGLFEFTAVASTPAECGEDASSTSGSMINNPRVGGSSTGFDIAFVDYRCVPSSTANSFGQYCSGPASSCRVAASTTVVGQNCLFSANSTSCGLQYYGCAYWRPFYPRAVNAATYFHPYLIGGSVIRINRIIPGAFIHELGHFLGFGDYASGCDRVPGRESSRYSYGASIDDWTAAVANQPTNPDLDCYSTRIENRDRENLHAIYHPQAFTNLELATPKGSTMLHLKFGAPPTDLRGNEAHVAHRYVILHRPPIARPNAAPNTFIQLMNNGTPVVLTPEQTKGTDNNVGELEGGRFVLTSVNLNDPAFAPLRVTGHEFVVVGVTKGDHKREPDRTVKPLNPVSAAGLEHAVMSLNLGSVGVDDWTLGTPVSVVYP